MEGAWQADGKGESVWDNFTHTNFDYNGDIACDSYNNVERDVEMLKRLHLNAYRFSLSWPRFFPDGKTFNPDGVKYYQELVDALLTAGIQPMITLFHWDTPQILQEEFGGWANRTILPYYLTYAEKVFDLFADKVSFFFTLNEPYTYCLNGHGIGTHAPGLRWEDYLCGHHQLLAHAEVYHLYDKNYRSKSPDGNGKISFTCNANHGEPENNSNQDHIDAADRFTQFSLGWFFHPVFSDTGDYPPVMREYVDRRSPPGESRLPVFTSEEIEKIKGSADFIAVQPYTSRMVAGPIRTPKNLPPQAIMDMELIAYPDPVWPNHDPRDSV